MKREENIENCKIRRRMGAILYDSLLLFSVLLFASIPALVFSGGEAIDSSNRFYQGYLFFIGGLYFILPWRIKGQTLGMQSWKIKLVSVDGTAISWSQLIKRVLFACLSWLPAGLGFIWSIFDRENLTWHDRLSKTKLIHLKK